MDELVRWLGVQLDADKARAAQWHDLECSIHEHQEGGLLKAVAALEVYGEVPGAVCDCGGPARVLREIDAKRQALDHYARVCQLTKDGDEAYLLAEGVAAKQIQIMGTAYDHRPGYRDDWRP
jgi:hypothetical protein